MKSGLTIHIVSKKAPSFTQIRKGGLWKRIIKTRQDKLGVQVHLSRQQEKSKVLLVLLTLNLFRWLSGTVSLSEQLQQLPMASSEGHVSTAQKIMGESYYIRLESTPAKHAILM